MPAADTASQSPRRDAERNRSRVLAAARVVFARDGLNASMASVAREAGVGIATAFRHFPTKGDLVAAAFTDRVDAYVAAARAALDDPDPWHGLVGFIETVCAMQADDYAFADVLTMSFPPCAELEQRGNEAYRAITQVIDRAKAAGRLREDFTAEDLVLLRMANAGVINATGSHAPDAWRRFVAQMIQSYEAPARAPLPDPPTPSALSAAMHEAGQACYAAREQGQRF